MGGGRTSLSSSSSSNLLRRAMGLLGGEEGGVLSSSSSSVARLSAAVICYFRMCARISGAQLEHDVPHLFAAMIAVCVFVYGRLLVRVGRVPNVCVRMGCGGEK